MGRIIVLAIAILPLLSGGIRLFAAEAPGPGGDKYTWYRHGRNVWLVMLGIQLLKLFLLKSRRDEFLRCD
jgi:trk system potassium uptake protein TrkH